MADVFQAVKNVVKSLADDEPKLPLHIGAVMACWTYLAAGAESLTELQVGLNTTTDADLKKSLEEAHALYDAQVRRLRDFMVSEGIPLPDASEPKPKSDQSSIPLGAKLMDNELANQLSIKVAAAIVSCATAASESIRNDMGVMWAEFLQENLTYGTNLKSLMRKRGWLKLPPLYNPPGSPIQQTTE